jgi:serine/threonine protein kinase
VESLEGANLSVPRSTNQSQEHSLTFLGRGSHGFVDTVQNHVTGRLYARKTSSHKSFPQEIEIIKRLSHPHVIRFISAYLQDGLPKLIMSPVAQSTLGDWLEGPRSDANNASRVQAWIGCLSSALKHVHSEHIRHADVKPQNLLIRGSDIFITDFGISRVVSEPDSSSSSVSPSTPLYAPMEITEHETHVHGRKADVFSLGCVVLEMLSYAQGKGVTDLHKHLGLSASENKSPRDSVAYYKVRSRASNWIAMMREQATETTQALWSICEHMLNNDSSLRPSSAILLAEVRRALENNDAACEACRTGPVEKQTYRAGFATPSPLILPRVGGNKQPASSKVGSHDLPRITPTISTLGSSKTLPRGPRHKSSTTTCTCPAKETRSSALGGLSDLLAEYEKASFGEIDIFGIANSFTYPPPAYHDLLLYPASISVTEATAPDQPHEEAGYAAQMVGILVSVPLIPRNSQASISSR